MVSLTIVVIADSHDGMFLMNEEGLITFASPSIQKILGFEPEEVIGRSGFEFVHPEDYGWAFQSFQLEVSAKSDIKYLSLRLRTKEGSWLWCSVRGFNMLHNPSVNSIVAYFHDDTLRKTASEALRTSEQRFRNLIRDIQIGVILYDSAGKVILCNKFIAHIHNSTEEQLVARDIYEVISHTYHEDGRKFEREERPLYRAMTYKEPVKDVVMGIKLEHNTEIVWLLVNTDPILDEACNNSTPRLLRLIRTFAALECLTILLSCSCRMRNTVSFWFSGVRSSAKSSAITSI